MEKRFLEQFVASEDVKKAEPMLCKLASRLLDLSRSRENVTSFNGTGLRVPLFISRDAKEIKSEILQSIKKNDWASVSILAAELDLKQSVELKKNFEQNKSVEASV